MSLNIAKAIHLLGVAMLLMSLGGLALHSMNGGTKENNPSRKLAAAIHGTGLLLVLGAGLHMIGGYAHLDHGLLGAKLLVWLLLGGGVALAQRGAGPARLIWFIGPLLVAVAAILGSALRDAGTTAPEPQPAAAAAAQG